MNAKFVVVVLVALQVSLSLCDSPQPDADLVIKYDEMKATFKRRLENIWNRIMVVNPDPTDAQAVSEAAATNEKLGKIKQVVGAVAQEIETSLDGPRYRVLGAYSAHLRPYIGEYLQDAINRIKAVLDQVMPADQQS